MAPAAGLNVPPAGTFRTHNPKLGQTGDSVLIKDGTKMEQRWSPDFHVLYPAPGSQTSSSPSVPPLFDNRHMQISYHDYNLINHQESKKEEKKERKEGFGCLQPYSDLSLTARSAQSWTSCPFLDLDLAPRTPHLFSFLSIILVNILILFVRPFPSVNISVANFPSDFHQRDSERRCSCKLEITDVCRCAQMCTACSPCRIGTN